MQLRIDRLAGLAVLVGASAACSTLRGIEPVLSPPSQFQHDGSVAVEFVESDAVGQRCAQRGVTYLGLPGFNSGACGSRELITMPDPCAMPDDGYARALCAGVGRRERVAIKFVHPDLAVEHCRSRNADKRRTGAVVCAVASSLVVVNPCVADTRGWYAETLCHELAHVNGWAANHAGGAYARQPSFVKAQLAAEDLLSPEAVRVALLAKAEKRQ